MLNLITGTPGSGKTLYAVYLIDKQENQNKANIEHNKKAFNHNLQIIEKYDLQDNFLSHSFFSKKDKQVINMSFDANHFDYLLTDERKENIFLDILFYNNIINELKSAFSFDLKTLKQVRHQYANIDGLKVDNVRHIHIDWRECPDGSIIFYDEIQLIDEYSNDNKKDEHGIIKYLTVHRHRAFDIYGITQFPRLVNAGFRDVVGLHYHLHRGWGAKAATVYVWANCREKPNSLGNKLTSERDFKFNYPSRLYKVYESTMADTIKLRIPTKFLLILLIPILGIIMLSFTAFNKNNFLYKVFVGNNDKPLSVASDAINQQQVASDAINQQQVASDAINQQQVASDAINNQQLIFGSDDREQNDFFYQQYPDQAQIRLAGCAIDLKNKCECFTQQMTHYDISDKECRDYVINRKKPFDPYINQP